MRISTDGKGWELVSMAVDGAPKKTVRLKRYYKWSPWTISHDADLL